MASLTRWTWVWVSSGIWFGQGSLECCSPWYYKDSDMTEQLNWTEELKGCSQTDVILSEISEILWEAEPPAKKLLRTSDLLVVDFSSQTFWVDLVTVLGRYNRRTGRFTICTKQYRAMETITFETTESWFEYWFAKYLFCVHSFLLIHVNPIFAHMKLAFPNTCYTLPIELAPLFSVLELLFSMGLAYF